MAFIVEEWRSVPSLPEYEASSEGRVRRLPHEEPMPHGGTRVYGGVAWHGIWEKTQRRYVLVYLGKTYRVARMVCEAFYGPSPDDKPNVLHRDENSRNNRADNLLWGTQKENLNAPGFIEYCKNRVGEHSPRIKADKLA